ncbi:bifunctional phosphopantothenoylcysteine decarboxylase/phosphopantothenate--cysteine ligase CoaBC [Thiolapillus brandeum]|uniref:Coenzyme A biosynthesis bifunctional protein CoaBC n=1 Tax=Thiolapillus brandeum TaxID=1076588 RepID=A0A7U6GI03_9GAMM|nr:bifunctional phosphopantothenoylcysteine decarboxylase/phosphopantothenate--cysteine ligase CoaBC [Thiolapillus brandeum]BAO43948.1 phosphopantothenoylcysteine decarboxylase / phosphopantothenate--cysteine ligase [Thiolapillus brandeum]
MKSIEAGNNLLLGVTGGIAAYKSVELARLFVKGGVNVRVVMTEAATRFIDPMTFQAVTGEAVQVRMFDQAHEAAMGHIELARWADHLLIAPASADFLARMANGLADDLLATLCLACPAPVSVAPAMNVHMWEHAATQNNISLLADRGVRLLGPASGEQACGDSGPGRMLEAAEIVSAMLYSSNTGLFAGQKVVVTAGPTREAVDPVRFISNRSSGKMGFALAEAFAAEGAKVVLVSGPVNMATPAGVQRVDVVSALQMHEAVFDHLPGTDVFAGCAAVADYRPGNPQQQKIKKAEQQLELTLVKNPDILAEVAALDDGPFTLGFAAETRKLAENARIKLVRKSVDMIAANLVGENRGFDMEGNALLVLWSDGETELPMQSKKSLARELIQVVAEQQVRK